MLGRRARRLSRGASSESGFSLIEVVVSLLLLSGALLGLAAVYPSSRVAIIRGDQVSSAVRLSEQTLEDMRNRTYSATTDELTAANFPSQGYGTIAGYLGFRRQVTITDNVPEGACTPAPGTPCTKTVDVSTFFRDQSGQEQSTSLRTVFVR